MPKDDMKYKLKIVLFLFFSSIAFSQSECPKESLLGKWADDKFGIEVRCDRIIILDKLNGWILSEKRSDTYYFLEAVMNQENIYVTWVQNYAMFDYYSKGKWQKTSSKQLRVFMLEINDDQSINFSMSEKKLSVNGLHKYASTNMIKQDEVFEKTFTLQKFQ